MPSGQFMTRLILILLLGTIGQCYGGTFDLDSIDNWQIYNGTELVLSGHDSPLGTVFSGTIKKAELKDLAIQFNHDVQYPEPFEVVVDFIDEGGNIILSGNFKSRPGIRFAFRKKGKHPANYIFSLSQAICCFVKKINHEVYSRTNSSCDQ